MLIFSSLAVALREGFRWHSFSASDQLHIVELDRPHGDGRHRVKALAFACPTPEELAAMEKRSPPEPEVP